MSIYNKYKNWLIAAFFCALTLIIGVSIYRQQSSEVYESTREGNTATFSISKSGISNTNMGIAYTVPLCIAIDNNDGYTPSSTDAGYNAVDFYKNWMPSLATTDMGFIVVPSKAGSSGNKSYDATYGNYKHYYSWYETSSQAFLYYVDSTDEKSWNKAVVGIGVTPVNHTNGVFRDSLKQIFTSEGTNGLLKWEEKFDDATYRNEAISALRYIADGWVDGTTQDRIDEFLGMTDKTKFDLNNLSSWTQEDRESAFIGYLDLLMTCRYAVSEAPRAKKAWTTVVNGYLTEGPGKDVCNYNMVLFPGTFFVDNKALGNEYRIMCSSGMDWVNWAFSMQSSYDLSIIKAGKITASANAGNAFDYVPNDELFLNLQTAITANVTALNKASNEYPANSGVSPTNGVNNWLIADITNFLYSTNNKAVRAYCDNKMNLLKRMYLTDRAGNKYYGKMLIMAIPLAVSPPDTSKSLASSFKVYWTNNGGKYFETDASQTNVSDTAALIVSLECPKEDIAAWDSICNTYDKFYISFNIKSEIGNTDTSKPRHTETTKDKDGVTSSLDAAEYTIDGAPYTLGNKIEINKEVLRKLIKGEMEFTRLYDKATKSQVIAMGELQNFGYDLNVTIYYEDNNGKGGSTETAWTGWNYDTSSKDKEQHQVSVFRPEENPIKITWYSDPEAYAEIKEGTVDYEETGSHEAWEAMSGVPSTEMLYFASGGSEFIVELELERVEGEEGYRIYNTGFAGTECEFKHNDGFWEMSTKDGTETFQEHDLDTNIKSVSEKTPSTDLQTGEYIISKFLVADETGTDIEPNYSDKTEVQWYKWAIAGTGTGTNGTTASVTQNETLSGHTHSYDVSNVTGDSQMSSSTVSATWTGIIYNPQGTKNEKAASSSHISGYIKGSPSPDCKGGADGYAGDFAETDTSWDVSGYYSALEKAKEWAEAYEKTNDDYTAKMLADSDGYTRVWRIGKASISVSFSGGESNQGYGSRPSGTYTSSDILNAQKDGTLANWGYNFSFTRGTDGKSGKHGDSTEGDPPKTVPHGADADGTATVDSEVTGVGNITYTIKVTFDNGTLDAHELCGTCCQHDLPGISDYWIQKMKYDYARLNVCHVYKIYRSYVDGMEEITFANYNDSDDLANGSDHEMYSGPINNYTVDTGAFSSADRFASLDIKDSNRARQVITAAEQAKRHNGTDTIVAAINQGDPNIFYNIGMMSNIDDNSYLSYANEVENGQASAMNSLAGRVRYSLGANAHHYLYMEEFSQRGNYTGDVSGTMSSVPGNYVTAGYTIMGSRSNKCDGMTQTAGSTNQIKVVANGHAKPTVTKGSESNDWFDTFNSGKTTDIKNFSNGITYSRRGANFGGLDSKYYDSSTLSAPKQFYYEVNKQNWYVTEDENWMATTTTSDDYSCTSLVWGGTVENNGGGTLTGSKYEYSNYDKENNAASKTKYTANSIDALDYLTEEYHRFRYRRNMRNTLYVISDMLILQTSTGDQPVLYHWKSQTKRAQQHYDYTISDVDTNMANYDSAITNVNTTLTEKVEDMWYNQHDGDKDSTASTVTMTVNGWGINNVGTDGAINVGGYLGLYSQPDRKYSSGVNNNRISTLFDGESSASSKASNNENSLTGLQGNDNSLTSKYSAVWNTTATNVPILWDYYYKNSPAAVNQKSGWMDFGANKGFVGEFIDKKTDNDYFSYTGLGTTKYDSYSVRRLGPQNLWRYATTVDNPNPDMYKSNAGAHGTNWGESADNYYRASGLRMSQPSGALRIVTDKIQQDPTNSNKKYETGTAIQTYMQILDWPATDIGEMNYIDIKGSGKNATRYDFKKRNGTFKSKFISETINVTDEDRTAKNKTDYTDLLSSTGHILSASKASSYSTMPGYTLEAVYSKNHTKVNDIVVQDPISVENAVIKHNSEAENNNWYADTRTDAEDITTTALVDKIAKLEVCSGNPDTCSFKVLKCQYGEDTVLFSSDFDTGVETDKNGNTYVTNLANTAYKYLLPDGFEVTNKLRYYSETYGVTVDRDGIVVGDNVVLNRITNNNGPAFTNSSKNFLSCFGTRWSIPLADLGITYSTDTQIKIDMDLYMNSSKDRATMLVSFYGYDFYIPGGRYAYIPTWNTGVGWERKYSTVSLGDNEWKVSLVFDFADVYNSKLYMNGVLVNNVTIVNNSNTVTQDRIFGGNATLNIGSWGINDNYPARFFIDNLTITQLAKGKEHTDECYQIVKEHEKAQEYTCGLTYTYEYGNPIDDWNGDRPYVFTAPQSGIYRVSAWGAAGGGSTTVTGASSSGGAGGFSRGYMSLTKGEQIMIYPGGAGNSKATTTTGIEYFWVLTTGCGNYSSWASTYSETQSNINYINSVTGKQEQTGVTLPGVWSETAPTGFTCSNHSVSVATDSSDAMVSRVKGATSVNVSQTWNFAYTGEAQTWTAPEDGMYIFEAAGAQGGGSLAGQGGITKGTVTLKKGDKFLIYVGEQGKRITGTDDSDKTTQPATATFNGGGDGGYSMSTWGGHLGGSGGGATDFRYVTNTTSNRTYTGAEEYDSRMSYVSGTSYIVNGTNAHDCLPGGTGYYVQITVKGSGLTSAYLSKCSDYGQTITTVYKTDTMATFLVTKPTGSQDKAANVGLQFTSTGARVDTITLSSLTQRVLVAGGGGGSGCASSHNLGNGGGLTGATTVNTGSYKNASSSGGSQTSGGTGNGQYTWTDGTVRTCVSGTGSFGFGANAVQCGAGGGGGYYGGGSGYTSGGGGGSSFVTGYTGCDTTWSSMQGGLTFSNVTLQQGGNTGNGYAKISKVGASDTNTFAGAGFNGGGSSGINGYGGGGASDIRRLSAGGDFVLQGTVTIPDDADEDYVPTKRDLMREGSGVTYGPYITASQGTYQVDIYGNGLADCTFDVYDNNYTNSSGTHMIYTHDELLDMKISPTHVSFYFDLPQDTVGLDNGGTAGLEVRIHHDSAAVYKFDEMFISRLEDRVIVAGGGGGADNAGGIAGGSDDGSGGAGGGTTGGNAKVDGVATVAGVALSTKLQDQINTIMDSHGAWKAIGGISMSGCGLGGGQDYGYALGRGESVSYNTDTGGAGGGYYGGYVTNHNNGGAGGGSGYLSSQLSSTTMTSGVNKKNGKVRVQLVTHINKETLSQTFGYTGAVQTYSIPESGQYKLEVWGAQGGKYTSGYDGGKGGYASGIYTFSKGTVLNIYVGQQGYSYPANHSADAPFNGGGQGYNGGGDGGGATDIRIGGTSLSNRIIVAGGGGGSDLNSKGGVGGNEVGGKTSGTVETSDQGHATGGTQDSGGTGGGASRGYSGELGLGGGKGTNSITGNAAIYDKDFDGGGGGGGYYGGASGWGGQSAGAGGSSYIGKVNYGLMLDGGSTQPSKTDADETQVGNSGNGAFRITKINNSHNSTCTFKNTEYNYHEHSIECFYEDNTVSSDGLNPTLRGALIQDYYGNTSELRTLLGDEVYDLLHGGSEKAIFSLSDFTSTNFKGLRADAYGSDSTTYGYGTDKSVLTSDGSNLIMTPINSDSFVALDTKINAGSITKITAKVKFVGVKPGYAQLFWKTATQNYTGNWEVKSAVADTEDWQTITWYLDGNGRYNADGSQNSPGYDYYSKYTAWQSAGTITGLRFDLIGNNANQGQVYINNITFYGKNGAADENAYSRTLSEEVFDFSQSTYGAMAAGTASLAKVADGLELTGRFYDSEIGFPVELAANSVQFVTVQFKVKTINDINTARTFGLYAVDSSGNTIFKSNVCSRPWASQYDSQTVSFYVGDIWRGKDISKIYLDVSAGDTITNGDVVVENMKFYGYLNTTQKGTTSSTSFGYTGGVQSFKPSTSGLYFLEVWGAQGGDGRVVNSTTVISGSGGKGGYSSGYAQLTAGTTYYVYVGGKGGTAATGPYSFGAGGYNGGGTGGTELTGEGSTTDATNQPENSAGGGGMTHISTVGTDNLQASQTLSSSTSYSFSYTGGIQTFTAPATGTYKLEVYGASGKAIFDGTAGKGGYSTGTVSLNKGDKLYIGVGGSGDSGGYNGGGSGVTGGGATHIAKTTNRGVLSNYVNNKSEILIVAGGGGGAERTTGGAGGGTTGGNGSNYSTYGTSAAKGGSQTAGGTYGTTSNYGSGTSGSFGQGGSGASSGDSGPGGGGGYYGGGGTPYAGGGGGGSGYIGGVSNGSMTSGTNSGDGKAVITLTSAKKIATDTSTYNFTPSGVLIAAGGGGGASGHMTTTTSYWYYALTYGGAGGGSTGSTTNAYTTAGTQNSGYKQGLGSNGYSSAKNDNAGASGGGGGGWYGGNTSATPDSVAYGGAGGSGYIGRVSSGTTTSGVNSGNGKATITQTLPTIIVKSSGSQVVKIDYSSSFVTDPNNLDSAVSKIAQYTDGSTQEVGPTIPRTLYGYVNPIYYCYGYGYNTHKCTDACEKEDKVLKCMEPHHSGMHYETTSEAIAAALAKAQQGAVNQAQVEYRAAGKTFTDTDYDSVVAEATKLFYANDNWKTLTSCYVACGNDNNHKTSATTVLVNGNKIGDIYINTDEYFDIYFPNTGDFAENPSLHGIRSTVQTRGMGYTDDMDTGHFIRPSSSQMKNTMVSWVRERYVKFSFDVLFYRAETGLWEQYLAGHWIELPVEGENNNVGYSVDSKWDDGHPIYHFYCTLNNSEQASATVEFESEAINCDNGYGKYNEHDKWEIGEDGHDGYPVYETITGELLYTEKEYRNDRVVYNDASNHSNDNDNFTKATNKDRRVNLSSTHGDHITKYTDVVGRIGNLSITSTTDIRFINFFKRPQENGTYLINGVVKEVYEYIQRDYLSWHYNTGSLAYDVRHRQVSRATALYNTWGSVIWKGSSTCNGDSAVKEQGTQSTIGTEYELTNTTNGDNNHAADVVAGHGNGVVSTDPSKSPLAADRNNIEIYNTQQLKPGYTINFDITTTGNYQNRIQVKPYFYALDLKNNTLKPIDVYMKTDDDYKGINYFGAADGLPLTWSDGTTSKLSDDNIQEGLNSYILSIDWENEADLRMYVGMEKALTEAINRNYYEYRTDDIYGNEVVDSSDDDTAIQERVRIPSGDYFKLGNLQAQIIGNQARSFIGTRYTMYENFRHSNGANGMFTTDVTEKLHDTNLWSLVENLDYTYRANRWHMKLGLPSSAVFTLVENGVHYKPLDEKMVNGEKVKAYEEVAEGEYAIIMTANIKAIGDVWNLYYTQEANNGVFKIGTKQYKISSDLYEYTTGNPADSQIVLAVYENNTTSEVDVDTIGTH